MDRLIQQAVLQILTPIFDPGFSESSFGFRPKRSAQDAAKQVQRYIRLGYRQCIDMDLAKFFDNMKSGAFSVALVATIPTSFEDACDGRTSSRLRRCLPSGWRRVRGRGAS